MASDPNLAPSSPEKGPISIIENEIPAYRAISSAAVFSLLLGLGSVLSFTHLAFVALSVAAILVGVIAIRNIARRPDFLTGANLARVGIALGLVFGVSSVTSSVVQGVMISREASSFAAHYAEIIKNDPLSVALWYQQVPEVRRAKNPDQVVEDLKKATGGPAGDVYETQAAPIRKIKARLAGKDEDIHFDKIESKVTYGLTTYVNALLELHGPGSKDFPQKEEYALLRIRKDDGNARGEWTVEEIGYPYEAGSHVEKVEAPDDGHGHAH